MLIIVAIYRKIFLKFHQVAYVLSGLGVVHHIISKTGTRPVGTTRDKTDETGSGYALSRLVPPRSEHYLIPMH